MSKPTHRLFGRPSPDLARGLDEFEAALQAASPLKAKHRAQLPGGIKRLSAQLTTDRDELPRDYMTRADSLAAYLHWFLPWNLYRQGLLLEGLDLDLPEGCRIVDLGAGPLTFLLSLWMARPHLRRRKLQYVAVDRAEAALKVGRRIYDSIAGESPWDVHAQRELAGRARAKNADLLVAANLLNEMDTQPRGRRGPASDAESPEEAALEKEARLLGQWERMVSATGAILVIEPGIRPAGRSLTRLRQVALERGWQVATPCPHAGECPQPGLRGAPWCHFTFETGDAPLWLKRLAGKVKLPKERASLSFLLLMRPGSPVAIRNLPRPHAGEGLCLVASEAFDLPGGKTGRYGCSERGLVLLQEKKAKDAEGPEPGDTLVVRWPEEIERDPKSKALILKKSTPAAGGPKRPSRRRT